MPYNDFFWAFNDEYRLNDSLNNNEHFFSDSISVTNKSLFKSNPYSKQGLLEYPYIEWSKSRIKLSEILPNTSKIKKSKILISDMHNLADMYNLDVKIYLDINSYNDSTNFISDRLTPENSLAINGDVSPADSQTHGDKKNE
jgi:hypothetical protein